MDGLLGVRRAQDHDATLSIKTEFMQHWDGLLTDTDVRFPSGRVLAALVQIRYQRSRHFTKRRANQAAADRASSLDVAPISASLSFCRPA